MKEIRVAEAVGVFANLGVLVGVLLLVYELAQNRDLMRAQIRSSISWFEEYVVIDGE